MEGKTSTKDAVVHDDTHPCSAEEPRDPTRPRSSAHQACTNNNISSIKVEPSDIAQLSPPLSWLDNYDDDEYDNTTRSQSLADQASSDSSAAGIKMELPDACKVPLWPSWVDVGEQSNPDRPHSSNSQASTSNTDASIKVEPSDFCPMALAPTQLQGSSEFIETSLHSFESPPVSVTTSGTKRKRLHMDALNCFHLAQTETGAMALKNPAIVKTSSLDSNRGMYPQLPGTTPRGLPPAPHFSQKKKKPIPKKFSLSEEETNNQTTIERLFPVCPGKRAMPSSASADNKPCSHPLPASRTTAFSDHSSTPTFPKKNLNTQFASVGLPTSQKQAQNNTTLSTHQQNRFTGTSLAHSSSIPSSKTTTPVKIVLSSTKSQSSDNSLDAAIVDVSLTPPNSSPSKSVQSTDSSDVESFENESFFDDLDPILLDVDSSSSQRSSSQPDASEPPNTFGLLGEEPSRFSDLDTDDQQPFRGFDALPLEVLERIFCFVPTMDAHLRLSLVCKRWNEILSKEDFMPWKKVYHRMRMQSLHKVPEQPNLLRPGAEKNEDTCLLDLVRSMPEFKDRYGSGMDTDLHRHPKYDLAKAIMKSKAPELLKYEEPNPWSTICMLVLLSETVQDVYCILKCLLHHTASCTTMEVLECLYCIAAYLWKFKISFEMSSGYHYRVYHALHLFENSHSSVPLKREGPSDLPTVNRLGLALPRQSMPPTDEQWHIINYDINPGKVVKVVAFAGTGKTTTLVKYAERRPNTSFLYVAFNKSVQKHAKEIFPGNVESRTIHSLAFSVVGYKYRNKLVSSLNPVNIHWALPPGERKEVPWLRYANLVCKTIKRFCASDNDYITTQHVPSEYHTYKQNGDEVFRQRVTLDHALQMKISNDSSSVWEKMTEVNNRDVHITHDVYLKLYQLKKPWYLDYDCLLIDEAQDLTPAQEHILLNQPGSKILVGDPHQQIYSFRGATDTMRRVQCEKTFHLTQSFRFGTEIAYIANCLLERATSRSTPSTQTLIGKREPGHIDGEEIGKVAIITRTNVTLFKEAVRIVETDSTTSIAFAGGIGNYGLDVILDIYQLQQPEQKRAFIKNKYIWSHENFGALKQHAMETDDIDLMNKIKIVDMYNIRIPEIVEKIQSRTRQEGMADVILTTAHKAKGLEFETVMFTNDFGICTTTGRLSPLCTMEGDELNLVYVAITRARKSLVLTNSLIKFIGERPTWEKFVHPAPVMPSSGAITPCVCINCHTHIHGDCAMLLQRKACKLAYPSTTRKGGICCRKCSIKLCPTFSCLLG
ncbi:F-box DNA helicase 1-like [Acanthaster planci]|uniref:DNA 3'-5' helicase n=1 Tax=Acanthaster planci TaxID=133434 RepID=A0A8B7Z5Z2_ACAPL|nr:F-box DNA helicase 1-like [Acanthaster planci]XP_022100386.1 F-box DNA helicase 1-like [Acanthaster planci]